MTSSVDWSLIKRFCWGCDSKLWAQINTLMPEMRAAKEKVDGLILNESLFVEQLFVVWMQSSSWMLLRCNRHSWILNKSFVGCSVYRYKRHVEKFSQTMSMTSPRTCLTDAVYRQWEPNTTILIGSPILQVLGKNVHFSTSLNVIVLQIPLIRLSPLQCYQCVMKSLIVLFCKFLMPVLGMSS